MTPNLGCDATPRTRARGLARWGEWCARRPFFVIGAWGVAIAVLVLSAGALHATFTDNVSLAGTQAATGQAILVRDAPATPPSNGVIVFSFDAALTSARATITQALSALRAVPDVATVSAPFTSGSISRDGHVGYSDVGLRVAARSLRADLPSQLDHALAPVRSLGVEVSYGGAFDQVTTPTINDHASELIGFAVALVVLLVVFGSFWGALVPLASALVCIVAGLSLLDVAGSSLSFGASAPKLAAMIGIGVGIDYAVFLTTRYRQHVKDGLPAVRAAGLSTGSSGRAIVVAASTVSLAMIGLYASGVTFIGLLGLAAVFGVLTAALGAITLVPAFLGLCARRIDTIRVRRTVAEAGADGDGWHRYAAAIGRHPWSYLSAGVIVLALIASPVLVMQTGHVGDGAGPAGYTSRQAYDTLARGFGPGVNGSFTIVVARGDATGAMSAHER